MAENGNRRPQERLEHLFQSGRNGTQRPGHFGLRAEEPSREEERRLGRRSAGREHFGSLGPALELLRDALSGGGAHPPLRGSSGGGAGRRAPPSPPPPRWGGTLPPHR